jgi:hypothetical protein
VNDAKSRLSKWKTRSVKVLWHQDMSPELHRYY